MSSLILSISICTHVYGMTCFPEGWFLVDVCGVEVVLLGLVLVLVDRLQLFLSRIPLLILRKVLLLHLWRVHIERILGDHVVPHMIKIIAHRESCLVLRRYQLRLVVH